MVQVVDIFELIIDILNRCCGWVVPEKYFTFELDIIVGTIIKIIGFIYSLFLLDILNPAVYGFYSAIWTCQALFVLFEKGFIFDGISRTTKRQFCLKYLCIAQSFLGAILYFISTLTTSNNFFLALILLYILAGFFFLDLLQLLRISTCNIKFEDYESVGFSLYFIKFRLIGGIIGTIIMLIIYLVFRNQEGYQVLYFQYFLPAMIISEVIILSFSVYQLRQKRKKEKLIVDDKTKNKLKMKKWYCIIIGFSYGLVEVLISLAIDGICIILFLFLSFLGILHSQFSCKSDLKIYLIILSANEIKDYEIVDQSSQQEDQLNPTTQV